ncbi:hypothetical protein L0F63_004597 [Massospora cicadina]|nr:hypothetical protein L0F63_004597 [Massospora cicadina]
MPAKTTEATHPKYIDMVKDALKNIKDRKGVSRPAISKYVVSNYKVPADKAKVHIKTALKRGVQNGALMQDGQRFRSASVAKGSPKKKSIKKSVKKSSEVSEKKAAAKGKALTKKVAKPKKVAPKKPSLKKTKKATKPKKVAKQDV